MSDRVNLHSFSTRKKKISYPEGKLQEQYQPQMQRKSPYILQFPNSNEIQPTTLAKHLDKKSNAERNDKKGK